MMWSVIVLAVQLRKMMHRVPALAAVLSVLTLAPPVAFADPAASDRFDAIVTRARNAGVNADDLLNLNAEGQRRGLTEASLCEFAEAVTRAAEEKLPYRPVYDRIRQGLVKNAPPDRIAVVVRNLERKLKVGAALVDGSLSEAATLRDSPAGDPGFQTRLLLIDQTTFAIEKGVPETSIAAIFSDLKVSSGAPAEKLQSLQSPVVALTNLASEGVPPERSLDFVTDACRNGARGPKLEELAMAVAYAPRGPERERLFRFVQEQLRRGRTPDEILREIGRHRPGDRGIRDGRPGGRRVPGDRAHPPDDPGGRRRPGRDGNGGRRP